MIHCQSGPAAAADVFNFQEGFFGGINDIFPAYIKQEPPPSYCPNLNKSAAIHAAHANGYNALSTVGYQQVSHSQSYMIFFLLKS